MDKSRFRLMRWARTHTISHHGGFSDGTHYYTTRVHCTRIHCTYTCTINAIVALASLYYHGTVSGYDVRTYVNVYVLHV